MKTSDERTPDFWRNLKVGDFAVLSDKETLSKNKGPVTCKIESIRHLHEIDNVADWFLYRLESPEKLWLMVAICDDAVGLRLLFEISREDFAPDKRSKVLDRGDNWLFCEPEDPNNFLCTELKFTGAINVPYKKGKITYECADREYSCETTQSPNNIPDLLATVVHYQTKKGAPSKDLFVIEVGQRDDEEGGLINLYLGNEIDFNDVEVVRQ